jgi:tetratricopeptide (TPR) repeat protein
MTNNKKGGGKKKNGKKKPQPQVQLPSAGDRNVKVVLSEEEKGFVPGFGYMMTIEWQKAYFSQQPALMVECARRNMAKYGKSAINVQQKASLLHMLGYSLMASGNEAVAREGWNYTVQALELVRPLQRSAQDMIMGVWPEECWAMTLSKMIGYSLQEMQMHWISLQALIQKTRIAIDEVQAEFPQLTLISSRHYNVELDMHCKILDWFLDNKHYQFAEKLVPAFEKRQDEVIAAFKVQGWPTQVIEGRKWDFLRSKSRLLEAEGRNTEALACLDQALANHPTNGPTLHRRSMILAKLGRMDEGLQALEMVLKVGPLKVSFFFFFLIFPPGISFGGN